MSEITIAEYQKIVDDWIKDVGVKYYSEMTNLAELVEEVGEVARIISRKYGDQSFKESDKHYNLADELSDVFFVLVCLANQTGIDLSEAIKRNMEKKYTRDKERHKKNPKLHRE